MAQAVVGADSRAGRMQDAEGVAQGDGSARDVERRQSGDRRAFLAGAVGMAAAGLGVRRRAYAAPPVSADVDKGALLTRLSRRITFHPTPEELTLAAQLGYEGYLEHHLNPSAIDDSAALALLAPYATLTMTPPEIYTNDADRPTTTVCVTDLSEAQLIRAIFSKRQLFERIVEFWTDHFNIDLFNGDDLYLKPIDDRDVIRANALGTFPALLLASAMSPAMLLYLDNNVSRVGSPNENYARELLELHTLGVTGPYTQQDVVEVARCFTGWQFWSSNPTNLDNVGRFRFNSAQHDAGQKVVLGNVIPARPAANGMQDGIDVINILAAHPATANYIARKMVAYFLGEGVSESTISSVASVYLSTNGDIKAMIRAILKPNILHDAPPKYKRPFHLVVSAIRATAPTITQYASLRNQLTSLGMRPFAWGPPDGYPDKTQHWIGLILPRMSFGALLMNGTTGSIAGVQVSEATFYAGATTAQQGAARINDVLFAGEMTAPEKSRLTTFMGAFTTTQRREAIGVAIGSPSFQWF